MARQPQIKYTEELKAEIWRKYKQGESLWSIARSLNRSSSSIYRQLAPTGGIPPTVRKRSRLALSLDEREEISRGLVAVRSIRSIAARLGRAPSTISREIRRNGGRARYRAARADQRAWDRARRPKRCKLACNPTLGRIVESKLRRHWERSNSIDSAEAVQKRKHRPYSMVEIHNSRTERLWGDLRHPDSDQDACFGPYWGHMASTV